MNEELQAQPYSIDGYKQQFVDLPAGTLLFRANNIRSENDGRDFFFDFLGVPTESGYCMSPVHNLFSFPYPYVGFGLNVWGDKFRAAWAKYNCIQVYVLKCSAPMINMISPSREVRGNTKEREKYKDQPIQRCDTFGAACAATREEKKQQLKYLSYDNCLVPAFREQTGCLGYIGLGANDSLDVKDNAVKPRDSAMGQYLRLLSQTNPVDAASIVAKLYVDRNKHRGIPEIVMHPLKPGIKRELNIKARTFSEAAAVAAKMIRQDVFVVEPLACITKDGYNMRGAPVIESELSAAGTATNARRLAIEEQLYEFMKRGQEEGFGDAGKIMFDSRTGFYVLTGFADGRNGFSITPGGVSINYDAEFLRPLGTAEERSRALLYSVVNKKPIERSEFLYEKSGISGYKKAFIFKRPGSIKKVVRDIGINVPDMMEGGRKFSYFYKFDDDGRQTGGRTIKRRKMRSKLTRKNRIMKGGAGLLDFFGTASVSKEEGSGSIAMEQESVPEPIMKGIQDFFAAIDR